MRLEMLVKFVLIALIILLLPLIIIVVPIGLLLSKPKKRTGEEVADLLKGASEKTLSQKEWDRFASKPIRDERLNAIRLKAAIAGPPNQDRLMLRQLEKEARSLGSVR